MFDFDYFVRVIPKVMGGLSVTLQLTVVSTVFALLIGIPDIMGQAKSDHPGGSLMWATVPTSSVPCGGLARRTVCAFGSSHAPSSNLSETTTCCRSWRHPRATRGSPGSCSAPAGRTSMLGACRTTCGSTRMTSSC